MAKSDNEARAGRVLDAAAKLFTHYGFDKTTVSDIAQEAGVSKGAIYLHFESKDDLFEALLMREIQKYTENWLKLIEADPRGGTMASIYKNTLYALNQSPFMSAIFKRDKHVMGNYVRKPGSLFQNRQNQSMRYEFVKMMQDAGAVRKDIDSKVTAHIMNMFAYGLVSMDEVMHPDDIPSTDDIIEAIADIMDKALTPPDGGNSDAGKAIIRQILTASSQQMKQPLNPTSK
jgi:AcrR family transcriptional regulator